jgi:hypothetical protein
MSYLNAVSDIFIVVHVFLYTMVQVLAFLFFGSHVRQRNTIDDKSLSIEALGAEELATDWGKLRLGTRARRKLLKNSREVCHCDNEDLSWRNS